jgi:HD-like signal output (HDOD) protein
VSVMMILVAVVCAVALAWWAFRRQPSRQVASAKAAQKEVRPVADAVSRMAPEGMAATIEDLAPAIAVPPELTAFQWFKVADLETPRREALLEAIKGIPRPPHSLQKLLSPEFVARASSGELSELVMGEPMIAAKVLSSVNAPFYGLHKPVTGIGQAVTFLGMSTVRNICVQYMLAEAFKPRLAISQRTFDGIWRASAIASELCVRLSKALNLPDQGALSTQVVLGFVGHLSAASLMPTEALNDWLKLGRLERAKREQEVMDLSAGEIGGLLMHSWGLPETLINGVREIDRVVVTPIKARPAEEAARSALSYFCARLGERLAQGQLKSLQGYDPFQDTGPDTFYLNQHLRNPMLRLLPTALASAELQEAMQQMLSGEAAKKA